MRRTHPGANRPFKTPMVPLVPILCDSVFGALIIVPVPGYADPAGGVAGDRTGYLLYLWTQAQQGAECRRARTRAPRSEVSLRGLF